MPPPSDSIWSYRQAFLDALKRQFPAACRYLRVWALHRDDARRSEVVTAWQKHLNLEYSWVFESGCATVAVWNVAPGEARALTMHATPAAVNRAEIESTFHFSLDREYFATSDFAQFRASIHSALESALDEFAEATGARDIHESHVPVNLERAFDCLALRICRGWRPARIMGRFHQDWSALYRDMQSVAKLIGISLPLPGRPRNIAR
jgi:hypothetical protein